LEVCEPSCIGRPAKPFCIIKAHNPLRVTGHMTAPEPSRAGRRSLEPCDMWQHQSPPEQGGRVQSRGHVATPEPTLAGRQGPESQGTW
jgi:hypothetical protein